MFFDPAASFLLMILDAMSGTLSTGLGDARTRRFLSAGDTAGRPDHGDADALNLFINARAEGCL
jgi:hypothetical protein